MNPPSTPASPDSLSQEQILAGIEQLFYDTQRKGVWDYMENNGDKDLAKYILALLSQEISKELEGLTEHQENTQDMERAKPGYSFEVIPATLVHERLAHWRNNNA